MNNKLLDNYFCILFSLIPITIIVGPSISLANILLIDFSFIFLILYNREYKFLYNKTVKLIIFLCLYLVFNSLISKNFLIGFERNFGFIRMGILFLAFNYFFQKSTFSNKVFIIWTISLLILTIDIYIESFFGKNILGYGEEYGQRIVSFFKDEPIVGGFLNAFYLIVVGYLFNLINKPSNYYKNIVLLISIFFIVAILLTGERSNLIKAFLGFLLFYFLNDFFKFKQKIFSLLLIVSLIGIIFNGSDYLKHRYGGQFVDKIKYTFLSKEEIKTEDDLKGSLYYQLYKNGFSVFKKYPFFGVGNKNFRNEVCAVPIKDPTYVCNTHPHQLYFEFLAEHGLIGSLILLFILFYLIFSKVKIILSSKNYIQIGCLIFLTTLFIPFLPSGAFFSDYSLTIFWINLSIMYSINKKTNIYLFNQYKRPGTVAQ